MKQKYFKEVGIKIKSMRGFWSSMFIASYCWVFFNCYCLVKDQQREEGQGFLPFKEYKPLKLGTEYRTFFRFKKSKSDTGNWKSDFLTLVGMPWKCCLPSPANCSSIFLKVVEQKGQILNAWCPQECMHKRLRQIATQHTLHLWFRTKIRNIGSEGASNIFTAKSQSYLIIFHCSHQSAVKCRQFQNQTSACCEMLPKRRVCELDHVISWPTSRWSYTRLKLEEKISDFGRNSKLIGVKDTIFSSFFGPSNTRAPYPLLSFKTHWSQWTLRPKDCRVSQYQFVWWIPRDMIIHSQKESDSCV